MIKIKKDTYIIIFSLFCKGLVFVVPKYSNSLLDYMCLLLKINCSGLSLSEKGFIVIVFYGYITLCLFVCCFFYSFSSCL